MRWVSAFIISLLIVINSTFAYDWTTNPGDGSADDPYQISTAEQLVSIGSNSSLLDKYFILMNDIDMEEQVFTTAIIAPDTSSEDYYQGTSFTGKFDGRNYRISNFTINGGNNDYLGLFGYSRYGIIKNVGLKNFFISGDSRIGGLTGSNGWSTSIRNCYTKGTVSGSISIGGLCGGNVGRIENCYSTSVVSGGENSNGLGGFCGENYGSIYSSFATGQVTGGNGSYNIGGLCGKNSCTETVYNCYATGVVTGGDSSYNIGGLCGLNGCGRIINSYSTGKPTGGVSSYNIGGFCGCQKGDHSEMINSFWDIDTSETTEGYYQDPVKPGTVTNVLGRATSLMYKKSTYTDYNWDFTNETDNGYSDFWRMCADDVDYPRLSWGSTIGDFACPDGVGMEDLLLLVGNWLSSDCYIYDNNYCGGLDVNLSGTVDMEDFALFAQHWLEEVN